MAVSLVFEMKSTLKVVLSDEVCDVWSIKECTTFVNEYELECMFKRLRVCRG